MTGMLGRRSHTAYSVTTVLSDMPAGGAREPARAIKWDIGRDGVGEWDCERGRVSARGTAACSSTQTSWQMLTSWHWFMLQDCQLDESTSRFCSLSAAFVRLHCDNMFKCQSSDGIGWILKITSMHGNTSLNRKLSIKSINWNSIDHRDDQ